MIASISPLSITGSARLGRRWQVMPTCRTTPFFLRSFNPCKAPSGPKQYVEIREAIRAADVVDVYDVEIVGLQLLQALLHLPGSVLLRGRLDLADEDELVATAFERRPEATLALAIDRRGVEVVDPFVERGGEHVVDGLLVDVRRAQRRGPMPSTLVSMPVLP